MGQELTLHITHSLNVVSQRYEITDYEQCFALVSEFISENVHDVAIEDKDQLKVYKETRATLNKAIDALDEGRIALKKALFNDFEEQSSVLKNTMNEAVKVLKTRIDEYTALTKPVVEKPKVKTLTIKGLESDEAKLFKVLAYAEKLGLKGAIN